MPVRDHNILAIYHYNNASDTFFVGKENQLRTEWSTCQWGLYILLILSGQGQVLIKSALSYCDYTYP